ncbi:hypothetical protein CANCADRAFT_132551 [Tortispora caseinolytica NRRL Y-17796]|uniref:AMP-dependent synthetase/ligase domain-containing protein n=1 Tax=Tortispora caseinolytica NRRL Y-17796 TaxID=767744 RepID=A0A1E4TB47_9ASCO|nr:hypothetical protein CANCADRAFT_132551 [Tortispora caseinolytica NRRL Y-17796]
MTWETAAYGAGAIAAIAAVRELTREGDVHPHVLNHQSERGDVREKGQSPFFRSLSTPFGYPLLSGLHIRDGYYHRNGTMEDICKLGLKGNIREFDCRNAAIASVYEASHAISSYIQNNCHGVKKAAILFPESSANLTVTFALANRGISTVIAPINDSMLLHLSASKPEMIFLEAGIVSMTDLIKEVPSIKYIFLDIEATQEQHAWSIEEVAEMTNRSVVNYYDLFAIPESGSVEFDFVPFNDTPALIATYEEDDTIKTVEYRERHIVSAIAGLLKGMFHDCALTSNDNVLLLYPWSTVIGRIYLYTCLVAGCNIATSSQVGGQNIPELMQSNPPTVITATPAALHNLYSYIKDSQSSLSELRTQLLIRARLSRGRLPAFTRFSWAKSLRLIYTTIEKNDCLHSEEAAYIKATLATHISENLVYPTVCGAICQTNYFDYRQYDPALNLHNCGGPSPSVEIFFKDTDSLNAANDEGLLCVRGPAVSGDITCTNMEGLVAGDGCVYLLKDNFAENS